MSKNNKRKAPVAFTAPPEPPFIRRMKEQLGYKEGPNIDTKTPSFHQLYSHINEFDIVDGGIERKQRNSNPLIREDLDQATYEDEADRDDEKPTVVVLRSGDLSQEEAVLIDADVLKDPDENDGKIKFKKPKKMSENEAAEKIKSKLEKKESQMAQVKNKTLLSFDDEEDDDN